MSLTQKRSLILSQFLPYRLSIVSKKVSRSFSEKYSKCFDLTLIEWRILAVLGENDYLSADDICRATEMDKVAVSRAVIKLLSKKIIIRKFSKRDRRRSMLRLSKVGISIYENIVPIATEFESRLISDLSNKERAQFEKLLNRLEARALVL